MYVCIGVEVYVSKGKGVVCKGVYVYVYVFMYTHLQL